MYKCLCKCTAFLSKFSKYSIIHARILTKDIKHNLRKIKHAGDKTEFMNSEKSEITTA